MTISIDENIPLLAEALAPYLPPHLSIQRFHGRTLKHEDLSSCLALLVRSTTRVHAELLMGTPVRFVGTATSGSEHIDTDFLQKSGVEFHDARGCNANSVAEYVLFAMLVWAEKTGQKLEGKTIGIVGYGYIGRCVAELAHKLGMKTLVSDPPFCAAGGAFAPYCTEARFHELLEESDVITNHVPLATIGTFSTARMFDKPALERVRVGGLCIHASRGGIVEEAALLEAIQNKRIHAAVDVWESEPLANADLARHCILATPHIAGYSYAGKIRGSQMLAENLVQFFQESVNTHLEVDWDVFEKAFRLDTLPSVHLETSSEGSLLAALRQSRFLEEDTASLIARLDAPNPEAGFDELRKNYPKRYEILRA
jgi:erythronate-4-phosphate dehydrogenase